MISNRVSLSLGFQVHLLEGGLYYPICEIYQCNRTDKNSCIHLPHFTCENLSRRVISALDAQGACGPWNLTASTNKDRRHISRQRIWCILSSKRIFVSDATASKRSGPLRRPIFLLRKRFNAIPQGYVYLVPAYSSTF